MASSWVVTYEIPYEGFEILGVCVSKPAADAFVDRLCELYRQRTLERREHERKLIKADSSLKGILRPLTDKGIEATVKRYRAQVDVDEWPLVTVASAKKWRPE